MEYLKKYEEKLDEGIEFATKVFEKNLLNASYLRTVPAFVYFMKEAFVFKYQLRELEVRKRNGEKMDFSAINSTGGNLNKAITALNNSHKNFGEKTTISIYKIKGAGENELFYKLHKTKFSKWTAKTPREKIIKTLELWTGEKGEQAVLRTINELQLDADLMFDRMLDLHNRRDLTNAGINASYQTICISLFNYYLKHRKKYLGTVADKRIMTIADGKIKLALKDEFIDINIKFKACDFRKLKIIIRNFIEALDKLDFKIMSNLLSLVPAGEVAEVDFRRLTKKKILETITEMGDDIECMSAPTTKLENISGQSIESILKTVEKFIEAEKSIEENLKLIMEFAESQRDMAKKLFEEVAILTGPDTRPCLARIAPGIKAIIFSDENNFNKKKLTQAGEKKLRELLNSQI